MAFETVQIQSLRNGSGLTTGYRDDLAQLDVLTLSLTSTVGVTGVQWWLVGRPEGSSAGGAGPEPISLGTGLTASFTVDADSGSFRRDGTYNILAVINPGSPGAVRKFAILIRQTGRTIPGPSGTLRMLRKLGAVENLTEDTSVAQILQGWATMLNRWLDYTLQIGSEGGASTLAATYLAGTSAFDQTLSLRDSSGGGVIVDASQGAFTGATAFEVMTAGSAFAISRATGNVGVGTTAPAQPVHVKGTAPALRLDRTSGAAIDAIVNTSDELQFKNGSTVLAQLEPTGGLRADLGLAMGTAPATAPVAAFGPASTVGVSTSNQGRIRYNESASRFEYSVNTGPWTSFAAAGSAYTTVDAAGTPLTQRSTLNASTGLTAVDNSGATRTDLTVNLSTGISGGQSAIGGTGAGEVLTLRGTSNSTPGNVRALVGTTAGQGFKLARASDGLELVEMLPYLSGSAAPLGVILDGILAAPQISVGTIVNNDSANGQLTLVAGFSGGPPGSCGLIVTSAFGTGDATGYQLLVQPAAGQLANPFGVLDSSGAAAFTMAMSGAATFVGPVSVGSLGGASNALVLATASGGQLTRTTISSPFVLSGGTLGLQGVVVTGGTSTTPTSLGSLGQGVLQQTVASGTSTPAVFSVGAGLVPFGASSGGGLTADASLAYTLSSTTLTLAASVPVISVQGSSTTLSASVVVKNTSSTSGSQFELVNDLGGVGGLALVNSAAGNTLRLAAPPSDSGLFLFSSTGVAFSAAVRAGTENGGWLNLQTAAAAPAPTALVSTSGGAPVMVDTTHRRLYVAPTTVVGFRVFGQDDGSLSGAPGILKTDTSGVHSIAVSGVDYQPAGSYAPAGNYITALNGDVVATGPGAVSATIQANVVTNAKLRQSGNGTLIGNSSGATANVSDQTVTAPLFLSSGSLFLNVDANTLVVSGGTELVRGALTGDVTASVGSTTTAFRSFAAVSVLARAGGTSGVPTDLASTASGDVLRNNAGTLGWGSIPEASVTNLVSDLAGKVPTTRAVNTTAPLTGGGALSADLTLGISVFGASGGGHSIGAVPDPGATAGTTRYLREDATWQTVSTGGGFYQTIENHGTPLTQRGAWNASTGLTAADNPGSGWTDVTATLSTGVAGGQSAIGGTGSGDPLTFSTTTNTGKGQFKFGAVAVLDESVTKWSIGQTTVDARAHFVTTADTTPSSITSWDTRHLVVGASTGTGGGIALSYNAGNSTGYISTATPNSAMTNLHLQAQTFALVSQATITGLQQDANGNVYVGTAALATGASSPYLGLPSMTAAPTSTPPSLNSGASIPVVVDTGHDRLYVGNSTWKPYGQYTGALSTGFLKNTTGTGIWTVDTTAYISQAYTTVDAAGTPLTQRSTLNASTGLTAVDNSGSARTDLTVNLSTGISGGQRAIGGTTSGNLTLVSNTAFNGDIVLGNTPQLVVNEATGATSIGSAALTTDAALHVQTGSYTTGAIGTTAWNTNFAVFGLAGSTGMALGVGINDGIGADLLFLSPSVAWGTGRLCANELQFYTDGAGINVLNLTSAGAVQLPTLTGPAMLVIDSSSRVQTGNLPVISLPFYALTVNPISNPGYLMTSSQGLNPSIVSYPIAYGAKAARIIVYVTNNSLATSLGTGIITWGYYLNGVLVNVVTALTNATAGGSPIDSGWYTGLGTTAPTDVWSVRCSSTGTYVSGSISFTTMLMFQY